MNAIEDFEPKTLAGALARAIAAVAHLRAICEMRGDLTRVAVLDPATDAALKAVDSGEPADCMQALADLNGVLAACNAKLPGDWG